MGVIILPSPKYIRTAGGAMGWLVGCANGIQWVAYDKADIGLLLTGLRRRKAIMAG